MRAVPPLGSGTVLVNAAAGTTAKRCSQLCSLAMSTYSGCTIAYTNCGPLGPVYAASSVSWVDDATATTRKRRGSFWTRNVWPTRLVLHCVPAPVTFAEPDASVTDPTAYAGGTATLHALGGAGRFP